MPDGDDGLYHFGRARFRLNRQRLCIRARDRLFHFYVIGQTGTGKTTLLETLLREDIAERQGFALLDPHGDLAERVCEAARDRNPIVIDLASGAGHWSYNPLTRVSSAMRPLVASGLLDVCKSMWSDAWGPRMEHVLRNALLALLDQPEATLPDILRLISDKDFRVRIVRGVENEQVRLFWRKEFPAYSWRYQADAIAPIQTKIGAFLADPRIYRFLTHSENSLRFRRIMDEGRVLVLNLAKGRLGSDSANLLAGLILTSLGLAAFSRADQPEEERRPFFIYADEFQNFTTLSVVEMLAELRKYRVGMVLAHQYLNQLRPEVRSAVLGNAGTIAAFRLGPEDSAFIAREFEPVVDRFDLMNLPNHRFYMKMMIDGAPSRPFSATTLAPAPINVF